MPGFDITEDVTGSLGVEGAGSSSWSNSNFAFDYAIAGYPFLSGTHDGSLGDTRYQRGFAPQRKQQIDTSNEPGEQSLDGWWLRSQQSWHGGAGIKFLEPASDERVMRRFADSLGVDVWTPGQVSLLPQCDAAGPSAQSGMGFVVSYSSSGDKVAYLYGNTVNRQGSTTSLTGAGTLLSVTDDGTSFYRLTTAGLYKGTIASGGDSAWYTTTPTTGVVGWVKQRIVAGLNNSIYELTGSGAPTLPTALYTHPNPSWRWVAIAEGTNAVYAAGGAGSRSAIYKFTLDQVLSGSGLPVLTKGTVVAELPVGETVNSIQSYLGSFLGITTNRGMRVAVIDGNGDLTYGPILWNAACYGLFGKDRYLYAGTTLSTGGGLIRVDLSDPDTGGVYPYATDLQGKVASAYVTSVTTVGTSTRLAFTTYNGSTCSGFEESSTGVLESTGWFQTGAIRYGTLEPKNFKAVKVRLSQPMVGTLDVLSVDERGNVNSLANLDSTTDTTADIGVRFPVGPQGRVGFRFTLNRATSPTTAGPVVQGFQVRSLPATDRKELLRVALMSYDFEWDRNGVKRGNVGSAKYRYGQLRDAVRNGDAVALQDLATGESLQVVVEDLSFQSVVAPTRDSGFGGIVAVTCREV